jgi:uncharacterized protein
VSEAIQIYVDADACPVKDEVLRVAERHGLTMHLVANTWIRFVTHPLVQRAVVPEGPDAADNWIADRAATGDIVVTQDIPLAARCLKSGAKVVGNTGKPYSEAGIGMALAMRDLSAHLRETGNSNGFNAAFTREDRSRFLQTLEQMVQDTKRGR